jgi:uncharacterized phosphosugar-binding protein
VDVEARPAISARAFGAIARQRIGWLVDTQLPAIESAGARVADTIAAGGRIWVTETSHTLHLEATHRAGGFMAVDVLTDAGQVRPVDSVLLGISAGTTAAVVDLALSLRDRRATVIALTGVPYETDRRVPPEHPSGKLLHEVADITIDLGGPFGDGEFDLDEASIRVIPSSGATGVVAMWMVFAEAVGLLLSRGLVPLMWQSNLIPGAQERNAAVRAHLDAAGVGYESSRVR